MVMFAFRDVLLSCRFGFRFRLWFQQQSKPKLIFSDCLEKFGTRNSVGFEFGFETFQHVLFVVVSSTSESQDLISGGSSRYSWYRFSCGKDSVVLRLEQSRLELFIFGQWQCRSITVSCAFGL